MMRILTNRLYIARMKTRVVIRPPPTRTDLPCTRKIPVTAAPVRALRPGTRRPAVAAVVDRALHRAIRTGRPYTNATRAIAVPDLTLADRVAIRPARRMRP